MDESRAAARKALADAAHRRSDDEVDALLRHVEGAPQPGTDTTSSMVWCGAPSRATCRRGKS
jgi:hypothetical protein